jgi:ferredoxin-nitrate reductase
LKHIVNNTINYYQIYSLAKCWNIEAHKIPSWSDPIHASSMFDLMQGGAIKMCWISGTNPAVSFVNLEKMRAILGMPGLFVVAQDIFETETTQLADVVLPAAMWGEKTGCFTNVGASTLCKPGAISEAHANVTKRL